MLYTACANYYMYCSVLYCMVLSACISWLCVLISVCIIQCNGTISVVPQNKEKSLCMCDICIHGHDCKQILS